MTTLGEVSSIARKLSRDFGTFFEINFASVGSTLRLPHPLVDDTTVEIRNNSGEELLTADTDYVVNARQGLIKLTDSSAYSSGVTVSGIYYEWFLDEDLEFFAQILATEHLYHRTGESLETITGAEVEVLGIGTLVAALWSLLAEFATDIDVSSPEGMNIPAHQRFQQTQALLQYWEKRYEEKAALLNVGLKKIEMFTLRRISRLTNRYVPIYRGREVDTPMPPVRVRPPIDPIEPTAFEDEEAYWTEDGGVSTESFDLGYGGWNNIGWNGT